MEKMSYEEATKRLSDIVALIEEGKIPMNKAIELFDEGKELIKICYSNIEVAKGKLTEIKETLDKLEEI